MSVSIETVWTVLVATIELCGEIRHAPDVVKDVKKATKRVQTQIGEIKRMMADPNSSFSTANAKIKDLIQGCLKDIVAGTSVVKEILGERKQIPWWEALSYLFWVTQRLPKLQDVVTNFNYLQSQIANVVTTFILTTTLDKQARLLRDTKAKSEKSAKDQKAVLEQIQKMMAADKKKKEEDTANKAAREMKKKDDAIKKLEKELKNAKEAHDKIVLEASRITKWAEDNKKDVLEAALHPDAESRDALVKQLVGIGLRQKDAAAKVDELLKNIRKERGRTASWRYQKQTEMPNSKTTDGKGNQKPNVKEKAKDTKKDALEAGKGGTGKDSAKLKNGTKGELSQLPLKNETKNNGLKTPDSKANDATENLSNTGSKQNTIGTKQTPDKKTERTCILFVDFSNGARSIMAQAYLEIIRNWTMNTQKRWLFEHVDSAGIAIPTPFNQVDASEKKCKPGVTVSDEAIAAIGGDEQHFQAKDPDEKQIILDRMRQHKSRGLVASDFSRFHHIVCFVENHQKLLEQLKLAAIANKKDKIISKIHFLGSCGWYQGNMNKDMAQLLKLRLDLEPMIERFLVDHYGWEKPTLSIALGRWRTLQVVVTVKEAEKLKNEGSKEIKKLGCRVHLTTERKNDKTTTLVSVSGPEGVLENARKIVVG
ncbi:uncharacterized protein BCR38DRAFT_60043 [Pseudomassariella vexata]|uniref:Uncharacterized protein n=1 Tax=Pseudomassariella vexata TaxID=1141098 RepID=A0A1Y2DK46_9PEZI|nr:uncharacterized protein BCR38DRAFT_60043 [Pseudomassariella vexata]ORY59602.1 hypothetical protein BCR38DRAFT_60043 [Pseudomassariella vexata]